MWEKWRLRKPTMSHLTADQGERAQSIFAGTQWATASSARRQFEMFLEASIEHSANAEDTMVTLKEKFEHQYAAYDEGNFICRVVF